jgi:hypothetical protein
MRCQWCSDVMGQKKNERYYKGFKELCRWCNTIAYPPLHELIPPEERKSKIY